MNIKLTEDRVLVRVVEDKSERRVGSIYLPDSAKRDQRVQLYEVVAVGPGRWPVEGEFRARDKRWSPDGDLVPGCRVPMSTRVGDRVLLSMYTGHGWDIDGVEHRIVHEGDILAYEERENA